MTIKQELDKLKMNDTYSLLLFILYRIRGLKEYSTLSELVYVLDRDNLLNLCEYFGGLTIKIPTIDELDSIVDSLLLYQYVNIDGIPYEEAINRIGFDSSRLRQVKRDYKKICEILTETLVG